MSQVNKEQSTSRYSRRAFLRHVGVGAGAVALSGGVGAAIAPRAVAAPSATVQTSPTKFDAYSARSCVFPRNRRGAGRAFRPGQAGRPARCPGQAEQGTGAFDHRPQLEPQRSEQSEAYGGHDLLRPVRRPRHHLRHDFAAGVPTDPGATANERTPSLDLDTVYGGGPSRARGLRTGGTAPSCGSASAASSRICPAGTAATRSFRTHATTKT